MKTERKTVDNLNVLVEILLAKTFTEALIVYPHIDKMIDAKSRIREIVTDKPVAISREGERTINLSNGTLIIFVTKEQVPAFREVLDDVINVELES